MSGSNSFLNGPNYQTIVGFLKQKYTQQMRVTTLPERLDQRIQKTVQHYMTEVARAKGSSQPVVSLNREVVKETTASVDAWMKKQDVAPQATTLGAIIKPDEYKQLFQDTNQRYEAMMSDRTPPAMPVPALPDFRPVERSAERMEDPVALMQREQKAREDQARTLSAAQTGRLGSVFGSPGQSAAGQSAGASNTVTNDEPRLDIRDEAFIPPQAENPPPLLGPRPQEYIIKQEDIVKYKEMEYNVFITSGDRDWLRNTTENRYNFTVNFNTGTKKTGYAFNTAIQQRFRNIQRIEFVKAIMPIESLTTLVRASAAATYDTTRVVNIFSLPFVGVRIDELELNGYSTRPDEDATFAIVQYDTTWSSDLLAQNVVGTSPVPVLAKSGYTGFIPKFLKTQRVYSPTPLATLQKLSIQIEDHTGEYLSSDSDVHFIKRICMSSAFSTIGSGTPLYSDAAGGSPPQNSYIFLQTNTYFPFSAVSEGDNLEIQGYTPATTSATATDFANYINNNTHYVIAAAYVNAAGAVVDGRNNAGYCNVIIIRSRFNDPTTGSVLRTNAYFGGGSTAETTFANLLDNTGNEPNQTGAALLNTNRQTHLVLRIITRDMDSASNIRPDNV